LNINRVFEFPVQCFCETFLILRTTELDMNNTVYRSPCAVQYRHSYHILTRLESSQQIFEK